MKAGRALSKVLVVFYVVLTPLAALSAFGGWMMVAQAPQAQWETPVALASTLLALLLPWRIWLHARSGQGGQPALGLWWRIALGVPGGILLVMGLAYAGFGVWIAVDPSLTQAVADQVSRGSIAASAIVIGLIVAAVGALMATPLVRALLRKAPPAPADAFT